MDYFAALNEAAQGQLRPAPHPEWVPPMLATLTEARFSDPRSMFERKLDGERVLGFRGQLVGGSARVARLAGRSAEAPSRAGCPVGGGRPRTATADRASQPASACRPACQPCRSAASRSGLPGWPGLPGRSVRWLARRARSAGAPGSARFASGRGWPGWRLVGWGVPGRRRQRRRDSVAWLSLPAKEPDFLDCQPSGRPRRARRPENPAFCRFPAGRKAETTRRPAPTFVSSKRRGCRACRVGDFALTPLQAESQCNGIAG